MKPEPENQAVQLSIVIAAWNGVSSLRQCLASLEKQTEKTATEVIVVSNFEIDLSASDHSLPAKFLQLPAAATVPELRREGIALARGQIIALLEDHCIFDAEWGREIKKAHRATESVIGGSVENASVERDFDWAVYFYDYGKYMLPNKAGAADTLSGLNVSYRRALLEQVREVYQDGFFETFVNEELKKRGHPLVMRPSAIVFHNKNYEMQRAAAHCYHLARSFAARRVAHSSLLKRAFLTAAALVLPVLLPARIVSTTLKKGRHLKQLIRSLPFLILLMLIWSYGEFCGYLAGAGKSAGEWR
jgi:GT2 family glycosyltransferase